MSFYNTTSESGETLARAINVTNAQERYVLKLLYELDQENKGMTTDEVTQVIRDRKTKTLREKLQGLYMDRTGFDVIFNEVENHYSNLQFAIISVRRSMTDLCEAGILEKTDQKRKGTSGRNNYIYKMSSNG